MISASCTVPEATSALGDIASATHEGFASWVVASEFFTKGSCHQLAMALVSALDGAAFVAIYDHGDEGGDETDHPRLVHAAAMIGDHVLDIEDFVPRDVWIDRWSDLARDPNFVEFDAGDLPFEYISHSHLSFSEAIAARLVDYWKDEVSAVLTASNHSDNLLRVAY